MEEDKGCSKDRKSNHMTPKHQCVAERRHFLKKQYLCSSLPLQISELQFIFLLQKRERFTKTAVPERERERKKEHDTSQGKAPSWGHISEVKKKYVPSPYTTR